jgi:hypothetical protein
VALIRLAARKCKPKLIESRYFAQQALSKQHSIKRDFLRWLVSKTFSRQIHSGISTPHSSKLLIYREKNAKKLLSKSADLPINAANAPFGAWVNRIHPEMHATKQQQQNGGT